MAKIQEHNKLEHIQDIIGEWLADYRREKK